MIAIALANQPRLLIADEPTNSMEPTTQAQIFRLLTRLNQNSNTTILLISHDLQMLSQWADKINVLYCGQTVETAPSKDLVTTPHHPYTQALIRAIPILAARCRIKAVSIRCRARSATGAVTDRLSSGAALPLCATRMHYHATLNRREKSSLCLSFSAEYGERVIWWKLCLKCAT